MDGSHIISFENRILEGHPEIRVTLSVQSFRLGLNRTSDESHVHLTFNGICDGNTAHALRMMIVGWIYLNTGEWLPESKNLSLA